MIGHKIHKLYHNGLTESHLSLIHCLEILPNFVLTFGNSLSKESLDYVLLDQIYHPLDQV